jgi:hypothetical protein
MENGDGAWTSGLAAVSRCMVTRFHFVITPHHHWHYFLSPNTAKGYTKKAKGRPLSHSKGGSDDKNKRNNPKNNPKNARKRKAANDAKNRDIIEAQGRPYLLTRCTATC